jgi:hypothetical protein
MDQNWCDLEMECTTPHLDNNAEGPPNQAYPAVSSSSLHDINGQRRIESPLRRPTNGQNLEERHMNFLDVTYDESFLGEPRDILEMDLEASQTYWQEN